MLIEPNHPLAGLSTDNGFRIKEPMVKPVAYCATLDNGVFVEHLKNLQTRPRPPQGPSLMPVRDVIPNTKGRLLDWKLREHFIGARARNWPTFKPFEFHGQEAALCGGGPSLRDTIPELRAIQKRGGKVMTINRTQDFLMGLPESHGIPWIKPWAGILLEPTPNAAQYMKPVKGIRYYISSQCAPESFDAFEKSEHYIWHAKATDLPLDLMSDEEKKHVVPAIGSTCGLRAMIFLYMLGFRTIHLFGMDSCYSSEDIKNGILGPHHMPRLHAYKKDETIHDVRELVIKGFQDGDRTYWGNGNMVSQADEFQTFLVWRDHGLKQGHLDPHQIIVHGSGVIPDVAREYGMHADQFNERKAA